MLSIFINTVEDKSDTRINIYIFIITIIYVILHYIIFHLSIIDKYKYVFYIFVLCDIIFFFKSYKRLNHKNKILIHNDNQNENINIPHMILEKPYMENDTIHQYVPINDYYNIDVPRNRRVEEINNQIINAKQQDIHFVKPKNNQIEELKEKENNKNGEKENENNLEEEDKQKENDITKEKEEKENNKEINDDETSKEENNEKDDLNLSKMENILDDSSDDENTDNSSESIDID